MYHDDSRAVLPHCLSKELAGANQRCINIPFVHLGYGYDMILGGQVQYPELFLVENTHIRHKEVGRILG
jgi:hypothetical protein